MKLLIVSGCITVGVIAGICGLYFAAFALYLYTFVSLTVFGVCLLVMKVAETLPWKS